MGVRQRLAQFLAESGMSQAELGRRLDPPESRDWVSKSLRGALSIDADDIPRIAAALGLSPCAFFEEPRAERASYTDIFARAMAQSWQGGMTAADRQFFTDLMDTMRRYRDSVAREEHGPPAAAQGESAS